MVPSRSAPPSGTLGDFLNSNCQIVGAGSSLSTAGNNMVITLKTSFKPSAGDPVQNRDPGFIGRQNIYLRVDGQTAGAYQTGRVVPMASATS